MEVREYKYCNCDGRSLVKAVNIGETKIIATSLYDSSKTAVCVVKVVARPVTK